MPVPLLSLIFIRIVFATGAVFAFAAAAYVNFVERAVAAVVVILALFNVASYTEIDIFHNISSVEYSVGRAGLNYARLLTKRTKQDTIKVIK